MQKINRIIIKNFRQHRDVNLRFDSDNGVYIFIARNGSGKSNFLNALTWCLYEEMPFKKNNERSPILNEVAAKNNPYDAVEVTIEFQVGSTPILINRVKRESQSSHLTVKVKKGEDWAPVPDPEVIIENLLPRNLMSFFLFDGEYAQNLFSGKYSENLKNNVWKVSNIELLDSALEHFSTMKKTFERRLDGEKVGITELQSALEKIDAEISKLTKDIEEEKRQKEIALKKRSEYQEKAKGLARFKTETEKREILQNSLDNLDTELLNLNLRIDDSLAEKGILAFLLDPLAESSKVINEVKKKGELPPKIRGDYLAELRDSGCSCICGREIGKAEKDYITNLLAENNVIDQRAFLQDELIEINGLLRGISSFPKELIEMRKRKNEVELERKRIQKDINNINEILRNVDDQEMVDIEVFLQKQNELIDDSIVKTANMNAKLELFDFEKKQKDSDLKKVVEANSKNKEEKAKIELSERAINKLSEIRERIIRQVRGTVSSNANTYFKELIWKKDTFEKVKFEEDYTVTVLKRDFDGNYYTKLSGGETKLLGLATIKALTSISGFSDVPIFIDGPLEHLDKGVKDKFLETMTEFFGNKQLFIFSPDGAEIDKFAIENISSDRVYDIFYSEEKGETEFRRRDER
jgi:DNA sulfur modification protein DndD